MTASLKCSLSAVQQSYCIPLRWLPFQPSDPLSSNLQNLPIPFSLSADGHINTKKTSIQKNTSASIHLHNFLSRSLGHTWSLPSSPWKCCPLPWQRPVFHLCTRACRLSYLPKGYSRLPHIIFSLLIFAINNSKHTYCSPNSAFPFKQLLSFLLSF